MAISLRPTSFHDSSTAWEEVRVLGPPCAQVTEVSKEAMSTVLAKRFFMGRSIRPIWGERCDLAPAAITNLRYCIEGVNLSKLSS
jgi:hypothetical protein